MTAADALRRAVGQLRDAGIEDAARDARLLMAHAMQVSPARLTLHLTDDLEPERLQRLNAAVTARSQRQPVSQIIGQRQFWGRSFIVTPDVLDPRPETEILVAAALEQPFQTVLDLGTGSGCILLSCLADHAAASGTGADISPAALSVADRNAAALGLHPRCRFVLSDWCAAVEGQFDLIVANPPYIAADEMPGLAPEVRLWEPTLALSPGGDGLEAYRIIARQVPARLVAGGRLLVEIGPTQAAKVVQLFADQGLTQIQIRRDYDGRDRVVQAIKPD
ncbi:MAG: peptide chain release factor N(5)-glutamine methyltransferase [bacterium]